ncbi:MAG: stage 0 sporulation family protein [Wujia sp.]|nr:stage 0 sporulation family protein [Wujia sp.]MBO4952362.1 stage 0 sporulation family protein [Lachnospiraceae bacterium]MCI6240056.1 stage 0 sporulation family protein [Clostridium sp.]MDD7283287.1 stage 0 sporulation family protein [Clostridium sp.]MDY3726710.1 stage 0 sporulation family protein [Wujia sp.]
MKEVIGVRFRDNGKIYFFNPLNYKIDPGRYVIVETQHGVEFGKVVLGRREVDETQLQGELKPIIRIATEADEKKHAENLEKNKKAMGICKEKIAKRGLEMKLIGAEYSFDNSKVLFYFTADGRVDFRELVKDLAAVFKTRIELRQVGVRDETKIMGGIGICGRELCCNTHLSEFGPVSIKMAKEQNLSLNPGKISGVCGRLMCCLAHEQETYEYLNKKLPNIGDVVRTFDGKTGEVTAVSVLRQKVKLKVAQEDDTYEIEEYKVDELRFKPKKKGSAKGQPHGKKGENGQRDNASDKELKELESLERKEGKSKLDDD